MIIFINNKSTNFCQIALRIKRFIHNRKVFFSASRCAYSFIDLWQPRTRLHIYTQFDIGWWRGTVVERRSLAGELSLSCARPAADG